MNLPGFAGGSDVLSSNLAACALSVNLQPESIGPSFGKRKKWLPRTPGTRFAFSVGSTAMQELFEINGRAFGVMDTTFFEFFEDETTIVRGTVTASSEGTFAKPTICSNGSAGDQVMITSGGDGYIFTLSTNAFAAIADVDFPTNEAVMCEFFAGYFFVLVADSREIRWSALEDGTSWDPLDVFQRSWAADNIAAIKRLGTDIKLLGLQTSETLYATGDVAVFAPAPGSLMEHGCVAPFSVVRIETNGVDTTLAWLSQSERGAGLAVISRGMSGEVISTYAIARYEQLRKGQMTQVKAFALQMDGHVNYVMNTGEFVDDTVPQFTFTPVFDFTEQDWHDRAQWDSTECVWKPWRVSCHVYAFNKHYGGDRLTGSVYELSQDYLEDQLADVA